MQFHLDGFRPGDPDVAPALPGSSLRSGADTLPDEVDVLIVGCGPAGLTLAAQLSAFPGIKVAIVEQKSGPLQMGQADGIACRTMEMFAAFGFVEKVMREACWITEAAFWRPDPANPGQVQRRGIVQDVEDGLSPYPHVILSQARVHDFYLEIMRNSPSRLEPHYARRLKTVHVDVASGSKNTHPVTATFERAEAERGGAIETIKARYVVGCDGARSQVRQSIGRALSGDSANQAWGVMDVLAVTDFPDIRKKALVQSDSEGTLLIIPREGSHMVRIYVELDKLRADERVAARNITLERLIAAAQRIFKPYTFEVKETPWWSVYEIGQRLCDKFDDVPEAEIASRTPRVFIAGDACHTHSPKAGLGMNVSMQDAFNLGWKLAAVLRGHAPETLLHTYSAERQAIAAELIAFDREWAKMLSAPQKKTPDDPHGVDPTAVQQYFVQHGRYTAGTATRYAPALLTGGPDHQSLAPGFQIGTRFHSAPVVQLCDAKPVDLSSCAIKADGRFRLFLFASDHDPAQPDAPIRVLCGQLLGDPRSPIRRFTPEGMDIDALIDVRAIFQQHHQLLAIETMPAVLLPRKGRHGLIDYQKMFCPDLKGGADIFALRGINRAEGCVVVVRPDQYVGHVLPMTAIKELGDYFAWFSSTSGNT
jgi:2-polyprenyl-6-methoxyphenol hydroxylase-like FAD-dependent oxidoreductase